MAENRLQLSAFAERLYQVQCTEGPSLPSARKSRAFLDRLLSAVFPHFSGKQYMRKKELECELVVLQAELTEILTPLEKQAGISSEEAAERFFGKLPEVYDTLLTDAQAICAGDPAANCLDEVILAYPGFMAVATYRIAHEFYGLNMRIFARILTEYAHRLTGIDIHPGAQIGPSFCIDHGTGIVIGETTEIAENVKLYQGVTLGALSVEKAMAESKRHPTIKENVVIYANATVLGGDTIVGKNSIIGGNVWLTSSVPPNSRVYHKADVIIREG